MTRVPEKIDDLCICLSNASTDSVIDNACYGSMYVQYINIYGITYAHVQVHIIFGIGGLGDRRRKILEIRELRIRTFIPTFAVIHSYDFDKSSHQKYIS